MAWEYDSAPPPPTTHSILQQWKMHEKTVNNASAGLCSCQPRNDAKVFELHDFTLFFEIKLSVLTTDLHLQLMHQLSGKGLKIWYNDIHLYNFSSQSFLSKLGFYFLCLQTLPPFMRLMIYLLIVLTLLTFSHSIFHISFF